MADPPRRQRARRSDDLTPPRPPMRPAGSLSLGGTDCRSRYHFTPSVLTISQKIRPRRANGLAPSRKGLARWTKKAGPVSPRSCTFKKIYSGRKDTNRGRIPAPLIGRIPFLRGIELATFGVIFVNSADQILATFARQVLEELRAGSSGCKFLRYREGNRWLSVSIDQWDRGGALASELSRRFNTETIVLEAQTAVDYAAYVHFERGQLRREPKYCRESGGWLTVSGEPETWEHTLFSDELECLRELRELLADTTDSAEQATIENEIFCLQNHQILPGIAVPSFSTAQVGKAYGLPGFGPEMLYPSGMKDWWTLQQEV